jgi:hypothetical protein
MTTSFLKYPLKDGFIHNWLVAGPRSFPVDVPDSQVEEEFKIKLVQKYYMPEMEIIDQPVVRGKLSDGTFTIGDYQGSWEYYSCLEDHLVNCSGSNSSSQYKKSWAYTQLESHADMNVALRLTTPGPADIWVNNEHILRKDAFSDTWPEPVIALTQLVSGQNQILVRFENIAIGDCVHFIALQLCSPDDAPITAHTGIQSEDQVSINLPTTNLPKLLGLHNRLEKLFAEVTLERDVFERDHEVAFSLPDAPYAEEIITIRAKDMANIIFRDGVIEAKRGQRIPLNHAFELIAGSYQIELLPRVYEYYELNLRIKKDILFWTVGNAPYSSKQYGTYTERRREALLKATEQRDNLFADIARMALNWWDRVKVKSILSVIDRLNQQPGGNLLELSGMCGMLYRFTEDPNFPPEIRQPLETCIKNYPYESERTRQGADAILSHTCEFLSGQRFQNQIFPKSGKTGREHMQQGFSLAVDWLQERAHAGFEDWGSSEEITRALIALSILLDLAEGTDLKELAVVVMDKIFFSMAMNLYQGILSAPQRRATHLDLRGGLLQPTAGIARLMWGQGVFNHRIEGYVSLACMKEYGFPKMIAEIAANIPEEMWAKEQQARGIPVNKVTYRTPDYHLSSAQDYLPGVSGSAEHIWQATLGPGATVFVTNPGSSYEGIGMAPGYWVGNASLPRVAQWKNTLIAIYDLPKQDWMGFTHAYFPVKAFDDYHLRDGWAFSRKGDGYLAITASQGIDLVKQGSQAFKELRSSRRKVVWVCHMGREALDGDFKSFQEKILDLPVQFGELSVKLSTLLGDELSFDFSHPFLVNGDEIPLSDYPHFESLYSSTPVNSKQMDIVYGDTVLRLDFSLQSES